MPEPDPDQPVLINYGTPARSDCRRMITAALGCVLVHFLLWVLLCAGRGAREWVTMPLLLALPTSTLAGIGLAIAVRRSRRASPKDRQHAHSILWLGGIEVAIMLAMLLFYSGTSAPSERASRAKCRHNLQEIAAALSRYANSHRAYPPTVAELYLDPSWNDKSSERFVCPSSAQEKAVGTRDEIARSLATRPTNRSYMYLGGNLTPNSPRNCVLAYEPLSNHAGEGSHFLFKDGTIKWLNGPEAKRLIAALESGQNPPP